MYAEHVCVCVCVALARLATRQNDVALPGTPQVLCRYECESSGIPLIYRMQFRGKVDNDSVHNFLY